jgi:hypothetical protein
LTYGLGAHANISNDIYEGSQNRGNKNWNIYNNLFIGGNADPVGIIVLGSAVINNCSPSCDNTTDVIKNFEIHHNTFISLPYVKSNGIIAVGYISDPETYHSNVYNNLFYNINNPKLNNAGCATPACMGGEIIHDYNAFYNCTGTINDEDHRQNSTGNPFINSTDGNYRLIGHTDAGVTLSSPFNIDADG